MRYSLCSCSRNQGSCNPVVLIREVSSWRTTNYCKGQKRVEHLNRAAIITLEQESSAGGNDATLSQGLSKMYLMP